MNEKKSGNSLARARVDSQHIPIYEYTYIYKPIYKFIPIYIYIVTEISESEKR